MLLNHPLLGVDMPFMRKALLLMLLSAAFLGGYYAGQIPQSPHLVTVHRKVLGWVMNHVQSANAEVIDEGEGENEE